MWLGFLLEPIGTSPGDRPCPGLHRRPFRWCPT